MSRCNNESRLDGRKVAQRRHPNGWEGKILKYWTSSFGEAFRSALHSLWAHKLRSGLTLLSILIGVATIITIVSVISGLNHKISDEFESLGTKVLYVDRFPWVSKGRSWHKYRGNPPITMIELNAVKRVSLVEYVVPKIRKGLKASFKQNDMDIGVNGTSWEYPQIRKLDMEAGRFFSYGEDQKGRPVCVLGWQVWKNLFENQNPIGRWVKLGSINFRVIGVLAKQGASLTIGTSDNDVFVPYNAFRHIFGGRRRLSIMVSTKNPKDIDELKEEIRYSIRGVRGLRFGENDNFAINSQDMLLDEYNKTTRILWAALLAIAGLSLLVGGIGVMNIMLITVTERTREIGVRKAVGATSMHILSQFLLEALTQCWLGGTIGFVIGIGLPVIVSKIVPQLPVAISWEAVIVAIGFTTLVGVVFGLYPALKAAKLSPVEALRYE